MIYGTGLDIIEFILLTDDPDGAGPIPQASDEKLVTIYPLPDTDMITGPDSACEEAENLVFSTGINDDSYFEWYLPASLGTITFGGSGTGSNALVMNAASIPGPTLLEDSMWVRETNVYGCVGVRCLLWTENVYHLALIEHDRVLVGCRVNQVDHPRLAHRFEFSDRVLKEIRLVPAVAEIG